MAAQKIDTITMICSTCSNMSDFNVYLERKKVLDEGKYKYFDYKYCRCPNCDSPTLTDETLEFNKTSFANRK